MQALRKVIIPEIRPGMISGFMLALTLSIDDFAVTVFTIGNQGLETLSLRVERHVENALKVVNFLNNHQKVKKVNHPSLSDHPDHALYQRYFPNGAGSIFTFEVKGGQEEAHRFIKSEAKRS